jgi:hypothetical protein
MRLYDIYAHPRYGTTAVAHGFSWSAFFVPSVWAATKGLGLTTVYLIAATTLVFKTFTDVIANHGNLASVSWLALILALVGLGLFAGSKGYLWVSKSLHRDGFLKKDSVIARNARHAIKSFKQNSVTHSAPRAA